VLIIRAQKHKAELDLDWICLWIGLNWIVFRNVIVIFNNRKKTSVYHNVNGDHALFHTSKTAKIIKVILLRAPWQNVNVLLSNITFIIFAVFDV